MVDGSPDERDRNPLPGVPERRELSTAGTADTVCGLCGVAAGVVERRRNREAVELLEAAVGRCRKTRVADRQAAPADPDLPGGEREISDSCGLDAGTQGIEQERRRDALYDLAGGVPDAARALLWKRRDSCRERHRKPQPGRDRRIDRNLRQPAGVTHGPVRGA